MSIAEKLITIAENEQKVYKSGQLATLKESQYMNGKESGTIVSVNDVTPIEHNVGVKLSSDTITDFTGVEVARYGKNLYDIQYLADNGVARIDDVETGEYTIISTPSKAPVYIPALPKTSYRVSGYVRGVQEGQNILVSCYYTDGSNDNVRAVTVLGEFVRFDGITRADKTLSHIVTGASGGIKNNTTFKEFQVELAETATDYEPCNKTIYTANADGTVEGVKSISPNMTLIPNSNAVTVECEYLRDIDLYIDNLLKSVAMIGGE